jgi:hypothetical protein
LRLIRVSSQLANIGRLRHSKLLCCSLFAIAHYLGLHLRGEYSLFSRLVNILLNSEPVYQVRSIEETCNLSLSDAVGVKRSRIQRAYAGSYLGSDNVRA